MQWVTDPNRWHSWQRRLADWVARWLPEDPEARYQVRVKVFRLLAVADIVLGLYYFVFRYTRSVNVEALWFSIPLLLAETYSFIGTLLFILTLWRPARRVPPPPPRGATVDVFITTYNEPVELVRKTVEGALRIYYPHNTYVLDDGNRPEMRAMCEALGCGYITRGPEWEGRPRHAKAGNINNALMQTSGEFILILDADQIPMPTILHRTLGYFRDPKVAFVQTPQFFYNVPDEDPFGSQAPLFYGPIQQGKDGWNAAFFCGSNAVLRREALMQLGVLRYVQDVEQRVLETLNRLPLNTDHRVRGAPQRYRRAAQRIRAAAREAMVRLREGQMTLEEVLHAFHQAVRDVQREMVLADLQRIVHDLGEIASLERRRSGEALYRRTGVAPEKAEAVFGDLAAVQAHLEGLGNLLAPPAEEPLPDLGVAPEKIAAVFGDVAAARAYLSDLLGGQAISVQLLGVDVVENVQQAIARGLDALSEELLQVAAPPPEALGLDEETVEALQLETGEALDVQPLVTFSITEDMATALQLHALGWKSVFHAEILAYGLAPEDLGSALKQRLRWAAGTIQVLLYDNPLTKPGLSWGQRLMYFMTMYSYFSGFASLVYLLSPVIYLFTGVSPVVSFAGEFLIRIVPYLLLNQVMYQFAAWGLDTLRGEQFSLALFPIWIQAVVTVFSGRKLRFTVTPKSRQEGVYLNLVWPQLSLAVMLTLGVVYALVALVLGWRNDGIGIAVNIFWAVYDIWMLSPILRAAVYRGAGKTLPPPHVLGRRLIEAQPEHLSLHQWRTRLEE